MKRFRQIRINLLLISILMISIKAFSQTVTIYSTGFEFITGAYILGTSDTVKELDYWATNDNSVQLTEELSEFCNTNDEIRNSWAILSNSTEGSSSQYSMSGNSLGMCSLWGPDGLTYGEETCNQFPNYYLEGGFNCFYDVPTDRWAYR